PLAARSGQGSVNRGRFPEGLVVMGGPRTNRAVPGYGPLVGRHDELAAAADALRHPGGAGLVIVGAAGVGKSRLAQEGEVRAAAAGFAVVSVAATRAASTVPLAALAPLLPTGLGALGEGLDAVRAAAAAIVASGGDRPLMVVVDDAHLLDPISATAVHHLV